LFQTFIKKDQIVTMDDKAALKVDGEPVKIDSQLLFQRLVTAANGSVHEEDIGSVCFHEFCTHLPSLFESPYLLREADKPSLADAIKATVNPDSKLHDDHLKYVVDGGCLLQWLPWPRRRNLVTQPRMGFQNLERQRCCVCTQLTRQTD
jgi:hypothetical protein